MPVKIDNSRNELLADYAVGMLKDFYMTAEESTPQDAYKRAAIA